MDSMNEDPIAPVIETHLVRYPAAGILDVYKLLHQGVFGIGHLIASKKAAREWLEHEFSQNNPAPDEALVENIHPEGALVRLHLRPYLALTRAVTPLLDAMVRAAQQVQGDPDMLARRWAWFEMACQPDRVYAGRFEAREVRLFGQVRAAESWPAVHHSPDYLDAYRPAYRVLTRSEAEALCVRLRTAFEMI